MYELIKFLNFSNPSEPCLEHFPSCLCQPMVWLGFSPSKILGHGGKDLPVQGILTEGDGSVQLTSMYKLSEISSFF